MSYGPQRKKPADVFPIPKWYRCNHVHVSGRSCSRTTMKSGTACDQCQPVHGSNRFCAECYSMLNAFGMKADR